MGNMLGAAVPNQAGSAVLSQPPGFLFQTPLSTVNRCWVALSGPVTFCTPHCFCIPGDGAGDSLDAKAARCQGFLGRCPGGGRVWALPSAFPSRASEGLS